MTPRSIRRAAQRKANKLARKAAQYLTPANPYTAENLLAEPEAEFPTQESATETPAKPAAPIIPPAAAANAALTAIPSALTGDVTLLPVIDAAPYTQLLRGYQDELQPVGLLESNLVQSLAETAWRARRVLALEMALFAKGRIEFAAQFAEHNPDTRESLMDLHTFLTYEKQIRGLQLQEARLCRRVEKTSAELHRLQTERRQREKHARRQQEEARRRELETAAQLYQAAQQIGQPFQYGQNGFEFSNHEIDSYLAEKTSGQRTFRRHSRPAFKSQSRVGA
jgi:hypothetical protein